MATYTVKPNQNIFDVAIMLHGSVEGLFDLMISNEWLSMTTELKAGMTLEYHDFYQINKGIISEIAEQGYLAANGERRVYHKENDGLPVFMFALEDNEEEFVSFCASAIEGKMYVDWGDNSDVQEVSLTPIQQKIEHWFDNKVEERRIKIYGNFELLTLDISKMPGVLYALRNVTVDEFVMRENKYQLDGLLLFEGTYSVDLRGSRIKSLVPIGNMDLQTLDLRGAKIASSVVDEYLAYIVENYGTRRPCTVYLTTEPSTDGMEAIQTIIGEESWNQSASWVFDINGTIYTYTGE